MLEKREKREKRKEKEREHIRISTTKCKLNPSIGIFFSIRAKKTRCRRKKMGST